MEFKVGDRVLVSPSLAEGVVEKISNLAELLGYTFGQDRPMILVRCERWQSP